MTDVRLAPLPPAEAMAYFRSKGLAPADARFDYRDVWRGQHAASFVVAKAMQDDVATLFRDAILKAQGEGRSFRDFADELEPQLRAAGWWGRSTMTDPLTGEVRDVQLGSMHRLGAWQLIHASRAPLTADNYAAARQAMLSMRGAYDRKINLRPGLLVVSPANEGAARRILMSESDAGGGTNIWRNTATLHVETRLN